MPLSSPTDRLSSIEWQVTRRLASDAPDGEELSTAEGRTLLSEAAALGASRVLLSGGDPSVRADLPDIVAHGASLGLAMWVLAPAAPRRLHAAQPVLIRAGLRGLATALHGPDGKAHDRACSTPGSFEATIELLQAAREAELGLEVRTALLAGRLRILPMMAELVASIGAARWTLLAPVEAERSLGALALERALTTLSDLAALHRFEVSAVAAPHLARVVRVRHGASQSGPAGRVHVERDGVKRLYVSSAGEVFPSAELPLSVGNVRELPLAGALDHRTIERLSDAESLSGKCGACSFRFLCGGSRARAFAEKADPWAEDPSCAYQPRSARGKSHPA